MEGEPDIPDKIESQEGREKITRESLIAFAKETPQEDPRIREMLLEWMENTRTGESSIGDIETSIMHTAMKYRLGFISKEEALSDLQQFMNILASEYEDISDLHKRLSELMYGIEDGTFEVIHLYSE